MMCSDFKILTCRACGKLYWEGMVFGFRTRLDPKPLTVYEEIMAKLLGTQRTYLIRRSAKTFQAMPRIGSTMRDTENPVLGTHICDPSTFEFGEQEPADYWGRFQRKTDEEGVPF